MKKNIFFKVNAVLSLILLSFVLSSYAEIFDVDPSDNFAKRDYQFRYGHNYRNLDSSGYPETFFLNSYREYLSDRQYVVMACPAGMYFNCRLRALDVDLGSNRCCPNLE